MNLVKKITRAATTSYPGLMLRDLLGVRPTPFYPRMSESVSDLFLWRNDDVWETYFDLFHIAGVINPDFTDEYDVLICLYDPIGVLINTETVKVAFGEIKQLKLQGLLRGRQGFGTFAIFHMVDNDRLFGGLSCIAERGYTSFRRKTDQSRLRSYVHGNLPVIGMDQHTRRIRTLGLRSIFRQYFYRPQVTFDDCRVFEICLANPVAKPISFTLELLDVRGEVIERIQHVLLESGSFCFSSLGLNKPVQWVNLTSKVRILRPIIFKYYESHFDVLHG